MFCNDDRCPFDLWAPAGGVVANRAFSGYAMAMSELDMLADNVIREIQNSNSYNVSINIPHSLNSFEANYVKERIENYFGGVVSYDFRG